MIQPAFVRNIIMRRLFKYLLYPVYLGIPVDIAQPFYCLPVSAIKINSNLGRRGRELNVSQS